MNINSNDSEKEPTGSHLGKIISTIRLSKKISLSVLAKRANLTASYISRIERGERKNPSYPALHMLAKSLFEPERLLLDAVLVDEGITPPNIENFNNLSLTELLKEKILFSEFLIGRTQATIEAKVALLELLTLLDQTLPELSRHDESSILQSIDALSTILKLHQAENLLKV
ncbi:XRE family transcriptional regulator [Paenibacillus psychroresistens]|uniref:XRE family transcriptional regulator n=1 Tax=Paenibacillus psychroresistens TaxID=1778678 RepID=A0A6B8REK0_9BACL|nr:helix-turn-helix transcriptional regulator [Paenibacillus psychroresistens]QGQ93786.1 XRE family transcriptional regulator [Paenibacillus psychroresistens]